MRRSSSAFLSMDGALRLKKVPDYQEDSCQSLDAGVLFATFVSEQPAVFGNNNWNLQPGMIYALFMPGKIVTQRQPFGGMEFLIAVD